MVVNSRVIGPLTLAVANVDCCDSLPDGAQTLAGGQGLVLVSHLVHDRAGKGPFARQPHDPHHPCGADHHTPLERPASEMSH